MIFESNKNLDATAIMAIAEQVPAMIGLYNLKSGEYLYINAFVRDLLGYEPNDFMKGGVLFAMSLINPQDAMQVLGSNQTAVEATDQGLVEPGIVVSFEYRMHHKDGHWVWVRTDGRVFDTTAEGKVNNILNVSFDISAQK